MCNNYCGRKKISRFPRRLKSRSVNCIVSLQQSFMPRTALLFLILLLSFIYQFSYSQGKGQLSGRVVDRGTQAPLPGISVLLQDGTGSTTDSSGAFRFTELDVKTYSIEFTGIGYKPRSLFNIVVNVYR
ncbi:MAG: carboxypeptidase-like regulatory domain-containing protein [Chitinophagaceae bacterium]|nr:MAG: carboxypeptidase-like regulatory domain-containing protein [Chitinophagaceae bacterium]